MALHYSHPASGSGPPSPSLDVRPRRLFPSSSSSSSSSSRAPTGISLPPTRASSNPFSSYLNFSPSHHPQSSSPIHQSTSYRRRRSSSSSREGGGRGIALLSPFRGRGGSGGGGGERGGSSSGGGHSGWGFPESSIREEAMEEESSSPSRSRGINTLEVLGGNWEAETQQIDMDEAQPSPSNSRRSYSSSSSSYHSSTATNRLFSTSNQTTTNPFLYGLPPSPTSSSSASRNNSGSSPTRTLSYPQSFLSRRSTLLQSRAPTQSTLPNDSPAFSDTSLPLEQDLMPSSPPASLQQQPEFPQATGNEAGSSSRPTSLDQGRGGVEGPEFGDALGLQMNEETTDLGGLELVKRRRGMMRRLEMEWREKWDGEVVEEEEVDEEGGGRDALGLELGKRKFNELDEDDDDGSPPSPRSSSSPATPEDRPRHLPVIKLVVRRVAVQQQEEDEELQPSTDSEDDKEDTDPSSSGNGSEWSPSLEQRASRSKGKTSMRLLQDRRSPSPVEGSPESSSSPSSSKRKRKSSSPSSDYPQTRRRTASSPLSSASPEKTMPSVPALPLDRNRSSSSTSSSALSSLDPTPLFATKPLPASAYSSLAAASSYPQPGSQNIDDDEEEDDLTAAFGPPSPASSSPLSSAPPSPQPNINLVLPPAPASASQPPQRRRSSVRANNAVASSRRTFKPNLKIEPGFDGWYRNFSIPTPLSSQVTSALGLPAQDASAPPRPMAPSAKRNDGGRGPMDLYSPRWVQGMGTEKTALCPICFEDDGVTPVSFKTKCSAYNYHLLHVHGISPSTGLPFSPPMDFRSVRRPAARPDERKKIRQGKCHECKCWIPVEGVKNIDVLVPEIFYWKHARDCHKSRLAGDRDIWKPSATLDRITTWIDGLGDEEKIGWVVPSEHRTPAAAAPAAAV